MLVPHIMSGQTVGVLGLGSSGMAAAASLDAAGVTIFAQMTTSRRPPCKRHRHGVAGLAMARFGRAGYRPWNPHLHPAPHRQPPMPPRQILKS